MDLAGEELAGPDNVVTSSKRPRKYVPRSIARNYRTGTARPRFGYPGRLARAQGCADKQVNQVVRGVLAKLRAAAKVA